MRGIAGVELPSTWKWQQLRHLTTVLRRGTPPDYLDEGPLRVLSQAANQWDGWDWSRTRFDSRSANVQSLKGYLEPHDIVINATGTGTVGRVGYFAGGPDAKPCIADGHLAIARTIPDDSYPRFAYYYLSSTLFQNYLASSLVAGATNQVELNTDRLGSVPIPLPPIEEQRRIADFLDAELHRLDKARGVWSIMLELLRLRRDLVIENAIGISGPQIPENTVPLKYLARQISVGIVVTPAAWYVDEGGVSALRGVNIHPGHIASGDLIQISIEGHALHRKSKLQADDLVVVRTGQAGATAVIPPELEGANCIDLLVIRPDPTLSSRYAEYILNSNYARRRVTEHSVGSIQAHFNVEAMKKMPIPKLSLREQQEIVQRIDSQVGKIDAVVERLCYQIDLLNERRQALITAAVTGQLDVTTARSGVR